MVLEKLKEENTSIALIGASNDRNKYGNNKDDVVEKTLLHIHRKAAGDAVRRLPWSQSPPCENRGDSGPIPLLRRCH